MEIQIRDLNESHIKAIIALHKMHFDEFSIEIDPDLNCNWPFEEGESYLKNFLHKKETAILIGAFSENNLIGFLAANLQEPVTFRPVRRTEITDLFVLPEHRSQSIGKILVEKFINWSKSINAERTFVITNCSAERSIKFYEKLGFKPYAVELELDLDY